MNWKCFSTAAVLLLGASSAHADFTYEQTSKMTGGMMAGMMKVAGAFSKQAREPMKSTIVVKGDRMATIAGNRINVVDLAAETMTDVDLEKKTYAVITFADFGRAMQKLSEKMGQKNEAQMQFTASVKQTGATKNINGLPAKEAILTLLMEGQDQQSGAKGGMNIVTDMWLAPNVAGYEEVKNFQIRMAQKLSMAPGMSNFGAMMGQQAGMAKGMAELAKEMSKLDGVPVLQVIRVGGTGVSGAPQDGSAATAQPQEPQAPPPTAGDVAGSAATGAAASRMGRLGGLAGGIGGGFGGFGRKKKEAEQPAAQAQQQTPPPAAQPQQASGGTPPGTLMELTTELTAFSSAPVDAARLSVPAGFKQVEHDMTKALK
ncbi:MAG TPA: hypothetical protein VER03_01165 [Bryobacteraceae bacterium]|nr:hypothetical protein [Bryobacteraceae bacterium]